MPAAVQTDDMLRLMLVAPSDHAPLAAGLLTAHLGLAPGEAAFRLAAAPSVLVEAAPGALVTRLAQLLGALGLAVRAEPLSEAAPVARRFDVAVQMVAPGAAPLPRLARSLGLAEDAVQSGLARPEGLVVALTADEIASLRHTLRRDKGVRLATSDPATALFDLFLAGGLPRGLPAALSRLGLARCRFSGAVAAALDRRTAAHLTARFGKAGAHAINRDFQRFDLYLTASAHLPAQQLADFLTTRCPGTRRRLDALMLAAPVRIETGLTRSAARQFQADYAAIGLETRLHLPLPGADHWPKKP